MSTTILIVVTVLTTLFSVALVGYLVYLGVVVRKLKRTTKDQESDIKNLFTGHDETNTSIINASSERRTHPCLDAAHN